MWEEQSNSGIPLLLFWNSNPGSDPARRQCQAGSLTGAVASQKVTEASKGSLSLVGNQVSSIRA